MSKVMRTIVYLICTVLIIIYGKYFLKILSENTLSFRFKSNQPSSISKVSVKKYTDLELSAKKTNIKFKSSPPSTISKTTVETYTNLEEFAKKTNIRVKYSQRNPLFEDLLKLKGELLDLESYTDPLTISTKCDSKIFLTVMVLTSPKNFGHRTAIRNSWAYTYTKDIKLLKVTKPVRDDEKSIRPKDMFKTVFVIGKSDNEIEMKWVYAEAKQYGDIIFGSLHEDYQNLTMKTRLGLKWTYFDCDTKYVLKTDDDVYVNPVKLTEWLKEMPREKFYTGWCFPGNPVRRVVGHKWYVSREEHPKDTYPPYCAGGGYLMSNDVLKSIIPISYGRKYFRIEDIYVGTMIHELKTVKMSDNKRHFNLMFGGRITNCTFNHVFLAHPISKKDMLLYTKMTRSMLTSPCPQL